MRESEPRQRPVFCEKKKQPPRAVFPKHEITADNFEDMFHIDAQVRFYFQLPHGFLRAGLKQGYVGGDAAIPQNEPDAAKTGV